MPWIEYSDSEVNVFHPIVERCLNNALKDLGIDFKYEVLHQPTWSKIIPDFVIRNKTNKKIWLIIEVKRTRAAVQSTRYQFQAMSYVQELKPHLETPFYILTNLEDTLFFKYREPEAKPAQQILEPGTISAGLFETTPQDVFEKAVTNAYKSILLHIWSGSPDKFVDDLTPFYDELEHYMASKKEWNSTFMMGGYEYLRGTQKGRYPTQLKDIRVFMGNTALISHEGSQLGFKTVFDSDYVSPWTISNNLLVLLYKYGYQYRLGDAFADGVDDLISKGRAHEGLVPTDKEVGVLAATLIKYYLPSLPNNAEVCDPAAGTGNLLEPAVDILNLQPSQLFGIEKEFGLAQALSIRLGLSFEYKTSPMNTPMILNKDVLDVSPSFYKDVEVFLLNPPYKAGIDCSAEKQRFSNRSSHNFGKTLKCNCGQIGLEGPFLEYVNNCAKKGSFIAAIMPKQYLVGGGPEAIEFRKYLITGFGLRMVCNYPPETVFSNVMKDTCILIGQKDHAVDEVLFVSLSSYVQDVDSGELLSSLKTQHLGSDYSELMPGVEGAAISSKKLISALKEGWKFINSGASEMLAFIDDTFASSAMLSQFDRDRFSSCYRGKGGNSGCSDLLFLKPDGPFTGQYLGWVSSPSPSYRNSKGVGMDMPIALNGDSAFFDCTRLSEPSLMSVVSSYVVQFQNNGLQTKKTKTDAEIVKILIKESKNLTERFSVLLPRDIRENGRAFIAPPRSFVSTNFIVIEAANKKDAFVLGSWPLTVFFQLQCEMASKSIAGTRKTEIIDLEKTYWPSEDCIESIDCHEIEVALRKHKFLKLSNPKPNSIDYIWGKILFGENGPAIIDDCCFKLSYLANRRNPK